MSKRKIGIDLSKWQVRWNPKIQRPDFAILRVGYGLMPDKLFGTFYEAGTMEEIPLGGYHYFSSGSPWKDQADFFIAQIKGKKIHKFALDIEQAYNNMSRDFALCAVKFLQYVQDATGIEGVLYTNPYTYKDHLRAHTSAVDGFPLWLAQYPSSGWTAWVQKIRETLQGQPWMKPTGRPDHDWWGWQFTDKMPGANWGVGSHTVDGDILNGTSTFVADDLPDDEPGPPPVDDIEDLLLSGELGEYLIKVIIQARRK